MTQASSFSPIVLEVNHCAQDPERGSPSPALPDGKQQQLQQQQQQSATKQCTLSAKNVQKQLQQATGNKPQNKEELAAYKPQQPARSSKCVLVLQAGSRQQ
jgi:hypothetical protein